MAPRGLGMIFATVIFGPMIGYAGYRNTSLDIFYKDGSDFGDFDVSISGFYIGTGVSF